MRILEQHKKHYDSKKESRYSLEEYLSLVKKDKGLVKSPSERLLKAIGKPKKVYTEKDPVLSRIFGNRVLQTYAPFADFYGLEETIESIVSFLKHSAQGLEESRQILYFLGPVGSAKSSLAERLKELMMKEPIFILADKDGNPSPVNESPLGIFSVKDAKALGVDPRYLSIICSPWATKRIDEYDGDLSKFTVLKMHPDINKQIALSKTEPGDETNQDISTLVGKLDLRQLEFYSQNDPDAYKYSGGLCLSNQGLLEFVEMFKAPIKVLHPLLTATQEKNYKGTEAISAIPFDGIILAHSNESEWDSFKNDKKNEAFLDRVCVITVPYCLRVREEVKIYQKLLRHSTLEGAPTAPSTLKMLAEFCVLSRLTMPDNSKLTTKMRVYDGENAKEKDNSAKAYLEYKEQAGPEEGYSGFSTRKAYKILAAVYNFDPDEVAADPIHLLYVLEQVVTKERFDKDLQTKYLSLITGYLTTEYAKSVEKDIYSAFLDSYAEYGQALFDRYIVWADHWTQNNDYRDNDTGQMFDREALNRELEKLEKPAEIVNPKDFRHEVVNFALRHQARNNQMNPKWTSYAKLKRVIENKMFKDTKNLLPVISFEGSGTEEEQKKHMKFIENMKKLGYTENQVKRVVGWHMRVSENS